MMGMWAGICCCGFALLVARLTDMFRGHIKATIVSLLVVGCAHWCWLLAIVAGWAPFSNGQCPVGWSPSWSLSGPVHAAGRLIPRRSGHAVRIPRTVACCQ